MVGLTDNIDARIFLVFERSLVPIGQWSFSEHEKLTVDHAHTHIDVRNNDDQWPGYKQKQERKKKKIFFNSFHFIRCALVGIFSVLSKHTIWVNTIMKILVRLVFDGGRRRCRRRRRHRHHHHFRLNAHIFICVLTAVIPM